MMKRVAYALMVLFVSFGMLGVAAPVFALGNQRALKGTIVALNSKTHTLTVAPLHGNQVQIRVARNTPISRQGRAGNFAKLRVGDKVNLKFNASNKQASDIDDAPGAFDIHGTVQAVDTTASTITIASEDGGNSVTLNVDSTTIIQRNGSAATLADLLAGDKVEAKYNSATMLASLIKTEVEDSELEGTVAALDTTANTLTISPADGSANVTLNIAVSTVFLRDDTVVAFTDLQVGDSVQAEFDSTSMIASKIEVDDSSSQDSALNR